MKKMPPTLFPDHTAIFCRTSLIRLFSIGIALSIASISVAETPPTDKLVTRIAFGSCIKQDQPAPILERIASERPEVLIFTGDNIYGDTDDMRVLRAKYQTLGEKPAFRNLTRHCMTLATWDDHDYGLNDGGATYPQKEASQEAFLDFWNVPADSPRRRRAGVYDAVVFGPVGKRVQVILLDTRYHRSNLKTGERRVGGPYYPDDDSEKTMLGQAQWDWLRRQLQQPAEVRLVVSSIQFAPTDAGQECWANLPQERERMLRLIGSTEADGVVFISGDRHWAEVSAIQGDAPYPIFDITSSSFNQIHPRGTPTENENRVSKTTYHRENYGLLEIDWSDEPVLRFSIRDLDGVSVIEQTLPLGRLAH